MSNELRIRQLLFDQDMWLEFDPKHWLDSQNKIVSLGEFLKQSPCLEWSICIVASAEFDLARSILRAMLLDAWSRFESERPVNKELGERVLVLQLAPTLFRLQPHWDYDPPLIETWKLVGEEELDAEFELAMCVQSLARLFPTQGQDHDPELCLIQPAVGLLAGLRSIWSEIIEVPSSREWQPDYLAPEHRDVDRDDAYIDSFLLARFGGPLRFVGTALDSYTL